MNRHSHIRPAISRPAARGYLAIEAVISLSLVIMLMGGLGLAQSMLAKSNELQLARQRCTAAAMADLDSMTATGKPITAEQLARLWPRVTLTTRQEEGAGQWAGLTLVTVSARSSGGQREVQVDMSRYIKGGK